MKKLLLTGIILGLVSTSAFAISNDSKEKQTGFIGVSTMAENEYAPNTAKVRFYVETKNKNLTIATDENKKNTEQALITVKKLLNEEMGDSVKTKSFNVSTLYTYSKDGKQSFDKYSVVNSFEVKTKKVDEIGKIISTALDNGVTRVNDLQYSLDTYETQCQDLISKASKMAKDRALSAGNSIGVKIGSIKELNTSCGGQNNYYSTYRTLNAAKMSMDSAEGSSAIPTEAGLIKIMANVNAQFWVNP